jgi:hypothetical protein
MGFQSLLCTNVDLHRQNRIQQQTNKITTIRLARFQCVVENSDSINMNGTQSGSVYIMLWLMSLSTNHD